MHHSENLKIMVNSEPTENQNQRKPIVEPWRAMPKTYHQAPTHFLKLYEEAITKSEARTAVMQLKRET